MPDGTLEPVRCGASNRCDYCAMFAALEAALVLKLDAHIRQPTVGITTTTRSADYSMEDFKKAERALWRQLRRELEKTRNRREIPREERIEYCGFIEFTTGDGTRSGGARRPHQHALTKGIDPSDALLDMFPLEDVPRDHPFVQGRQIRPGTTTCPLELRVAELWYRFTGDGFIVNCRPLRTPAGAIAYLTLHHHKKSQAPPPGFKGRRLRPSKGYYEQPIAELRQLARKLAAHERVIIAVKRVIARDLYHEEASQAETDEGLTAALVRGLRSLSDEPLELQLDIEGEVDHEAERRELVTRTVAELQRLRSANPPELVRVRERNILDTATGETYRRAIVVLGSVDAHAKKRLLADREAAA